MEDSNNDNDSKDRKRSRVSTTSASSNKKPSVRDSSQEDRTPKLLQSMAPDLTVVVGGVPFHHYKCILCVACKFFDRMLSTEMRERHTSTIELPDKDPEEWLQVYHFLETSEIYSEDSDKIRITENNAFMLLPWFDFLGMQKLVGNCDRVLARSINRRFPKHFWSIDLVEELNFHVQQLSTPLPIEKTKAALKFYMGCAMDDILGRSPAAKYEAASPFIKQMLLDKECGDAMWEHCLRHVELPKKMVKDLSREVIINSPLFDYIMEDYAIKASQKALQKDPEDDESDDDDTFIEFVAHSPDYIEVLQPDHVVVLLD